ncbi:MAG TPA: ATP-binding cassette domain-containing protein [Bacteroidales bacterium]|nr:ATP-binding cassette domain-containing protein [Bacteroidales bacterium]
MENILTIHGLSKRYGKIRAVSGLSLEVGRGQVFGILGPNGSGKTTTLSTILELIRADSGTFEWFGKPPSKTSRKRIGSVIESPNFFPYLTAANNLRIVCDIKEIGYGDIDRVLTLTGLYERRNSRFRTFSFGMKQRLAVASALLGNPEVMILDEPTNGLDPQGIAHIRALIQQVAAQGTTIIMASHLLDEVQKLCTHVAVLSKGKKLFDGKVSEVLSVSDSYELSARSLDALDRIVRTHPEFQSVTPTDGYLQVWFHREVDPGELNRFFYEQGLVLTHLSVRKRTLEQHFLALIDHEA